jgi:hypothetical protein
MKITKYANGIIKLEEMKVTPQGSVVRVGYKTLRGFIRILKNQNKILSKNNVKVKLEVTLPLPK